MIQNWTKHKNGLKNHFSTDSSNKNEDSNFGDGIFQFGDIWSHTDLKSGVCY